MSNTTTDRRWLSDPTPAMVSLSPKRQQAVRRLSSRILSGEYELEDVPCLCGARRGRLLADRERFGLPCNTYLCTRCGIVWQTPRLTQDSLLRFYQEDYRPIYMGDNVSADAHFEKQREHGEHIREFVARARGVDEPGRVVDVGCAAGGTLLPFRDAGWRIAGCDFAPWLLDYGRRKGLELVRGGPSSLAAWAGSDLVILRHVLEHVAEPRQFLAEVASLVRKDGFVYVGLPGLFHIFDDRNCKGDLQRYLQSAHLYHFTLATLSHLMSECGFRLVSGTEEIHALYQRAPGTDEAAPAGEATRILFYCRLLALEHWARRSKLGYCVQKVAGPLVRMAYGVDLHGKTGENRALAAAQGVATHDVSSKKQAGVPAHHGERGGK